MSLRVKQPEKAPVIEGGTYQGICYSIIELGTHHSDLYDKDIRQVIITWEIPELRIDVEKDGKPVSMPRVISKTYTASLSEKAKLYIDLVSWRSVEFTQTELEDFDLHNVLTKNCILTVINTVTAKGKTVAKVAAIAKLMKGMTIKQPENPIVSFDMDKDGITNIPEGIPDWIKEQIKSSIEYKGVAHAQDSPELKEAQLAAGLSEDDVVAEPREEADDIPF